MTFEIERPAHVHANLNRGTSTLYFQKQDYAEFYMRGGICWPSRYEWKGQFKTNGFAIMAGQEILSRKLYIFEETAFETVENILNQGTGQIEHQGLAQWFNMVWTEYFGEKYFYGQADELHWRFHLKVTRSPMVNPKPQFIEAPVSDFENALSSVDQYIRADQLRFIPGSELAEQIQMTHLEGRSQPPAVHALGYLLTGIERYPFRKHHVQESLA